MAKITRTYLNRVDDDRFAEIFESAWEDYVDTVCDGGRRGQLEFLVNYFRTKKRGGNGKQKKDTEQ